VLIFAAGYLFVLLGVNCRGLRVTWLLPLVWLIQSVDRCRHAPLFVVVALVAIAAIWPYTRWAAWLARNRPDFYDPATLAPQRPWWANLWLPVVLVSLALGLQVARVNVPLVGAGWARHDPQKWPVELLDVIKAHEPQSNVPCRLFNEYSYGGFVIYHAPNYQVFVDDRCEVFGGAWLQEFVEADSQGTAAAMTRWESQYGQFHFALTRVGSGFDDYFRTAPGWECLQRTATAAFYQRR
jgi:hypothetical protein